MSSIMCYLSPLLGVKKPGTSALIWFIGIFMLTRTLLLCTIYKQLLACADTRRFCTGILYYSWNCQVYVRQDCRALCYGNSNVTIYVPYAPASPMCLLCHVGNVGGIFSSIFAVIWLGLVLSKGAKLCRSTITDFKCANPVTIYMAECVLVHNLMVFFFHSMLF